MIPKTLHFIWIGTCPLYVYYAINEYKRLNASFQINFINYTVKKLEYIYFNKIIKTQNDSIIVSLIDNILNNNKEYISLIKSVCSDLIKCSHIPFIQLLCDILRLEILRVYGGLYIDCDTFPIKPFDEYILNNDLFYVYDKCNNNLYQNNYFIGFNTNNSLNITYFNKTTPHNKIVAINNNPRLQLMNQIKPFNYYVRRSKFFKCQLSQNDFNGSNINFYFEHYSDFRWGTNRVEISKFDSMFNIYNFLND